MENQGNKLAVRVTEAAKLTGLGRTQAYELVRTGAWPSIRVGRAVLIPLDGLRGWLDDQTRGVRTARP